MEIKPVTLKNGGVFTFLQVTLLLLAIGSILFNIGFSYARQVTRSDLDILKERVYANESKSVEVITRLGTQEQCVLEIKKSIDVILQRQLENMRALEELKGMQRKNYLQETKGG